MGNNVQDDALYAAFKAKDTRFDGRFFVGISSTGVYCRPVCQARRAKRASCTFFSSAAEAELGAPVETGIDGLTRTSRAPTRSGRWKNCGPFGASAAGRTLFWRRTRG